jgi:hypothetical protein
MSLEQLLLSMMSLAGLNANLDKRWSRDHEEGILHSFPLRLKSGLVIVEVGLMGGEGFKLVAKLDVV